MIGKPPEFVQDRGSAPRRASRWWFYLRLALDAAIGGAVAVHVVSSWAQVNLPQPQWVRLELDRSEERSGWLAVGLAVHAGLAIAGHLRGESRALRPGLEANWRASLNLTVALMVVAHAASWIVPTASGVMVVADVEPVLVEQLSSTWGGVPAVAALYVVGTALGCAYLGRVGQGYVEQWSGSRSGRGGVRAAVGFVCVTLFLFGAMGVIQRATGLPGLFTG